MKDVAEGRRQRLQEWKMRTTDLLRMAESETTLNSIVKKLHEFYTIEENALLELEDYINALDAIISAG